MLWKPENVVKFPFRLAQSPKIGRFFASSRFHNIQRTLRKNCVQTFPQKSIRSVVRGLKLTFLEAPAKKGHQISRTAPKCCEMLWNVVKSIFTTFHNILFFFTTFAEISQHFTKVHKISQSFRTGFTKFYKVLQRFTKFHKIIQNLRILCKTL